MLVGLVCALGEAQLMPIYHRLRGDPFGRRSGRQRTVGATPVHGTALSRVPALAGFPAIAGPTTAKQAEPLAPQSSPYLYESKFLVETTRAPQIESAIGDLLVPDPHTLGAEGTYNHTIYFDSPAYQAYNRAQAVEHVTVRPRIRAYRTNPCAPAAALYLELKRRFDRVIAKRRTAIDHDLADGLLTGSLSETGNVASMSSVLAEFQYLVQRFGLRPSVSVLYHRSAFFVAPDRDVRVTFDRLVQFGPVNSFEAPIEAFSCALPPDQMVVEVKYGEDVPEDLLDRLDCLGMRPQGFSKYACALAASGGDLRRAEDGCYRDPMV